MKGYMNVLASRCVVCVPSPLSLLVSGRVHYIYLPLLRVPTNWIEPQQQSSDGERGGGNGGNHDTQESAGRASVSGYTDWAHR